MCMRLIRSCFSTLPASVAPTSSQPCSARSITSSDCKSSQVLPFLGQAETWEFEGQLQQQTPVT